MDISTTSTILCKTKCFFDSINYYSLINSYFFLIMTLYYSCRPTQWPFWFGFVASFALIYVFNWVLFIITMVTLCMYSRRNAVRSAKNTNVYMTSVIAKHLLIAVVLSLLFGLGWAFGLIGTSSQLPEEAYTPAQYIFSIFMGIQGVLIFLLHTVRSQEAREEWKKWWYTATCRSKTQFHEQNLTGLSSNKEKEMQPFTAVPTIVENVHVIDPTENRK